MKIALIRHLPPLIAPGICYGRLDIPMRPECEARLPAIAADPGLIGATRLWASPARRCRPLAQAIAASLQIAITFEPRLQELDFGDWEGQDWESLPRAALDRWAASPASFRPPGGESGEELAARVREIWAELTRICEDTVIISHGGPLKILHALASDNPIDLLAPAPGMGEIAVFHRAI